MSQIIQRFLADESGATAIEYALVASLVSILIVVAATAIGTKLNVKFNAVSSGLS